MALVNVGGMVAFSHTYFTGNIFRSENGSKVESGIAHVGGGLTIEFTYSKNDKAFAGKNNIYKFHNCSFINNGCNWNEKNASNPTEGNGENVIFGCGGGIAATFKSHSEGNAIQLIDCILRDNIADWGGGYYVLFEGKSFNNVAYFRNVSMESNYAALSGGGVRFSFLQWSRALDMFGRSRIILGENSHLYFTSNRASLRGGAIYAYSQGPNLKAFTGNLLVRSSCFFGYINTSVPPRRWSARVTFAKNSAPSKSGKSVYCDTLQFCRSYGNVKSALQWSPVFHYTKNTHEYDAEPEIMTDPVQMNTSKNHWSGFIGESISPKVTLLDEKGDATKGLLKLSVISSDNSSIHLGKRVSHYIYINDGKSSVPISFNGNSSKENFRVRLSAVYTQMMEITVDNVTTTSCYGGYTFDMNAGKCVCLPRSEMNYGYRRCGGDGETIYLKKGYWATRASNGALIVIPCPVGYCH